MGIQSAIAAVFQINDFPMDLVTIICATANAYAMGVC